MLVCPLCRLALADDETTCPRDGHAGRQARDERVPSALRARFAIVERYGEGSCGELYLADDRETGRRGVLKVLRLPPRTTPAEKARLERELVKQATLASPVLSVPLATGDAGGVPWVFREWHEGVSLRVKLTRGGALPVSEALFIASQVATALDELHRAGLLHRDVEPGHILLNPQPSGLPKVTLIDAGVAARIETGAVFDVIGTPEYCSPEQVKGKLVSFRSDLYALGCVLFEMLTGTAPFQGEPAEVLAAQAEKDAPTPKVSLPAGVSTLLAQLLAKDPRERPFSAQQVRRALDPFLPAGARSRRRDATQTFERVSAKHRAPVPGKGTLPPPSRGRTLTGMPASSRPPPPPRQPRPDATEELSELDLVEAEAILGEESGEVSAEPSAQEGRRQTPPWEQTAIDEDGLDYDDLAETTALDRESAAESLEGDSTVPDGSGSERMAAAAPPREPSPREPERAVEPTPSEERAGVEPRPGMKEAALPILALAGVIGACGVLSLGASVVFFFAAGEPAALGGAEPAPEGGPVALVEPPPVAPVPVEAFEPPEVPRAEEPAAAEAQTGERPAEEQQGDAPPAEEARADELPAGVDPPAESVAVTRRGREKAPQAARRGSQGARAAGPSRLEQFNEARESALEHFRARRFAQAAAAYERATELNPRHAGSFAGLGASRLALGQSPRAVRAYRRAVALQPRHAGYHAALGQAYLAAGERNRARQAFNQALSLDPNNSAARRGLSAL